MKDLRSLVRRNIWDLAPYSTARDDYNGGAVDVWLDANESPYDNGTNRYPDPHQRELRAKIAALKGVDVSNLFLGNGSDEAIDLLFRVFCQPASDNVVSISPSYGMYAVAADINDVSVREVLLNDDFSLPVDRLLDAADEHTKIIWICSPNNPTSNAFDRGEIRRLVDAFQGIVVVDEAYIDFSAKGSMIDFLGSCPNLVVLQTMSKARGMAALRLGMAFASTEIVSLMAKVKYPYNIGALTQRSVIAALDHDISRQVAELLEQRDILASGLMACPCVFEVYPSDANFLLVKVTDADALYDALINEGVIVRNRSKMPLCQGCLRVTVGTPAENARVVDVISRFSTK